MNEYKAGDHLNIEFPNGTVVRAKVERLQTYPASGMPSDLIMKLDKGEVLNLGDEDGIFPLPEFLVNMATITKIK